MNTIICACISAGVTLLVCLINNHSQNNKIISEVETTFKIAQAVTDTKIDELTREVREHNNFAKRMPVVEAEITNVKDEVMKLRSYHEG